MQPRPVSETTRPLRTARARLSHCAVLVLFAGRLPGAEPAGNTQTEAAWLAPAAIAAAEDGKTLYIACASARRVDAFDPAQNKVVRSYPLPGSPSGLAVDGDRLYVTCAAAESTVCEIDLAKGTVAAQTSTGHTALSPVLARDRKTLFVCLKFNHQVALWDTAARRETGRIAVGREPVSAAPTHDGKFLLVAHHLPAGSAGDGTMSATVGVVDLALGKMTGELRLPNGSSLVRELRISPDGRHAALAHNLAHFQVPTTQVERGWMNTSALTLLDVEAKRVLGTVLLDEVDRGAANPWAVAWSGDGQRLFVTHAGTHEVSAVDFPGLLGRLAALRDKGDGGQAGAADDLSFLVGLRARIRLAGNGPRAMAVSGARVYVAGYFSDTLETLEISRLSAPPQAASWQRAGTISKASPPARLRLGEQLFNDATICFQSWQSCASCHSDDARVDGLNWDLLNDGLGNPKNTKSLLLSHRTPPAMSTGVRYSAEQAVRAGIRHILFAVPAEELAAPMDEWLKSLNALPSPFLAAGTLSAAARRGQELFQSARTACATCHKPGLFTDLNSYDVGTAGPNDQDTRQFDTPTLVELWRTAPYLHDGSAATLRDVLTTRNRNDQHGRTSLLSQPELNDLIEYLLSL